MNSDTTKKLMVPPKMNEKEYARWRYDQALLNMTQKGTPESIKEFELANKHLYEVEDAYRIGMRLLLERAQRVLEATVGLIHP
jgi:hypothetical protein